LFKVPHHGSETELGRFLKPFLARLGIHDSALKLGDTLEDATADAVSADLGEKALNHVEPRSRGRVLDLRST
jgi:hypothetical protein